MDHGFYISELISEIGKQGALQPDTSDKLEQVLFVRELEKKDYLLRPGQVSVTMNFIAKGCLRSFYVDEQGNEHTLQFGIESWWVNDLLSYLKEAPSRMYIYRHWNTPCWYISGRPISKRYFWNRMSSATFSALKFNQLT